MVDRLGLQVLYRICIAKSQTAVSYFTSPVIRIHASKQLWIESQTSGRCTGVYHELWHCLSVSSQLPCAAASWHLNYMRDVITLVAEIWPHRLHDLFYDPVNMSTYSFSRSLCVLFHVVFE